MGNSRLEQLLPRMLHAEPLPLVQKTAMSHAKGLSRRVNQPVFIKREDTQTTHSFKLRGAMEKMRSLSEDARARGIVAASAGNHAQGVALAARTFGCHATLVMPETTPQIKVNAVRELGARTILYGDRFHQAYAYATQFAQQQHATFIHPYDDEDVVIGQSSVGKELLEQLSGVPSAVFVPVGGGGLLAGIATVVKALSPQTLVYGVEPEDAASLKRALQVGWPVDLNHVGGFVDGASVRRIGELGFNAGRMIDGVLTVSNDEICDAIAHCFEEFRAVLEPAGALSIAGLLKWAAPPMVLPSLNRGPLVAIASGANVDFATLGTIASRHQQQQDMVHPLVTQVS